ncbi:DUF5325 family protein [Aquihabitans sp. G128]|uniref:DUF5325 family protein n=1 Tax=Aquihabitans sp. G128 TaxID=2849779 RepID=UPI0020B3A18F|nr:DUF5325 family protein [Aquihabitans sp. G128]
MGRRTSSQAAAGPTAGRTRPWPPCTSGTRLRASAPPGGSRILCAFSAVAGVIGVGVGIGEAAVMAALGWALVVVLAVIGFGWSWRHRWSETAAGRSRWPQT